MTPEQETLLSLIKIVVRGTHDVFLKKTGRTERNEILDYLKDKLGYIVGCIGCICVQLFFHPETKDMVGFEINPRFGGGYPLTYMAGGNFPELLIREYFQGEKVDYFDTWKDGMLMLRYDDAIYV